MESTKSAAGMQSKGDSGRAISRVKRVDQFWSRHQRQWHYKNTSEPKMGRDRFQKYTLVVRRIVSLKGLIDRTEIDIKSAKLTNVLSKILHSVEGLELNKSPPKIDPGVLFHCRSGLATRLERENNQDDPDKDLLRDITAALDFIDEEFGSVAANMKSLLQHGEITYDLLWALFPPREEVFTQENPLREPQAARFSEGEYKESQRGRFFCVDADILHHEGDDFGWGTIQVKIPAFEGTKKVSELSVYPIRFHTDGENLRKLLRDRGQKYRRLVASPTLQEYTGQAATEEVMTGKHEVKRFSVTGRTMIDPAGFLSQKPDDYLLLSPSIWRSGSINADSLGEADLIFFNHYILGFSFTKKIWGGFAIRNLSDVIWNETAFDNLIMDESKRKMVKLLVESHQRDTSSFDDIVKGKGMGLVGLLSGSPGVGKTLTAEAVAECSRRPLYMVSAGELGVTLGEVDDRLGMVLDVTRRWGCVLLIDEADVFLHRRNEAQLERNALVSIFLRRLEYFQGIVILTTNRWKDIDEAFKSRIHFKFHYPALNAKDRLKIWKNLLSSISGEMQGVQLGDAELEELAGFPLNGREIKNAVSCTASICRASKNTLTASLVKDILKSLTDDEFRDD